MADENKPAFKDLSERAQEAVTPRGTYLNPEMLDKGTGYPGAPKGNDNPEPAEPLPDLSETARVPEKKVRKTT